MYNRASKLGLAVLTVAALGMTALPALAQDGGETAAAEVNNKVITLNLESTDIYYAFKLLFQQVKVDYTIDPSIKGTPVTVNLKQPFRQAIDLLIKSSGLPITLQIESNVYQIVPKKEEVVDPVTTDTNPPDQETPRNDRVQKIFVGTLNGIDIVSALGGRFLSFTSSFGQMGFNPFGGGMMGGGMGGGMGGMGGGMGGMGGGMGMGGMGMGGMGGGMGMGGMGGGMGMGGMGGGMGGMGGGMMGGFGSRGR